MLACLLACFFAFLCLILPVGLVSLEPRSGSRFVDRGARLRAEYVRCAARGPARWDEVGKVDSTVPFLVVNITSLAYEGSVPRGEVLRGNIGSPVPG